MGTGSLSRVRLYAPFLALVAVQALLVAVVPSSPAGSDDAGGFPAGSAAGTEQDAGGPSADGVAPVAGTSGGDGSMPGADERGAGASTSSGGSATSTATAPDGEAGAAAGGASEGGAGASAASTGGDMSHCADNGRQTDVVRYAPECVPAWEGGDNGGSTYQGVTEDTIKIVWFTVETNEQLEAIGASAGAASEEDQREHLRLVIEWLNETYEFYGRQIELVIFEADCPDTPPDVPACRAEARRMLAEHEPFAVMWTTPLYPQIFDEFARAGVLSLGGQGFAQEFYEGRRPFRWDLTMDGTQAGEFVAEYYCKKLAGDNASHAGQMIHPSIGPRETTERKMGILTPETEANVAAANRVRALVAECAGEDVPLVTYESDIERAQEQSTANAAAMINAGVTTVVCMCDPIAPIFTTNTYTSQSYFPEHLVTGMIGIDFDALGRLYNQEQWQHAFGLSHISQQVPEEESAAQKINDDSGRGGERLCACVTQTHYSLLLGRMLQRAGPNLTPARIEEAMFSAPDIGGWDNTGGNPEVQLHRFGPGDYTANSDVREVYWDENGVSPNDGQPGTYVPMNDGRRYQIGELTSAFEIPQPER